LRPTFSNQLLVAVEDRSPLLTRDSLG
jgi:hypothetical protein